MAKGTGAAQGTSGAVARRTVVAAAGGAGLAAVLTACGGPDGAAPPAAGGAGQGADGGYGTGGANGTAGTDGANGTGGAAGSGGAAGGRVLARKSEIPEGGGKVFADQGVVVTQPAAGQFKAFSAMCTHQGCAVKDVADGVINCPCHGSTFDAADGSVKAGPATAPLAPASITVEGDTIKLA
ncbi:Rieske (2Fe-2S) protein [Streptomyces sp. enrichment culture]|uniref:Rieske (2Fe-2S) protein n=1 Tax=Streptomyces sp. enrichment culture TaxID=1795815 RepID=UPI003F54CDB1